MASDSQRLAFRDKFRSLHTAAFQHWFEQLAKVLHLGGDFQAIRSTSGDGGIDGFVISSSVVYQVYAPARMDELRDSHTAKKIADDFEAAFKTLRGNLRKWIFVHNHPDANLGKLSIAALAALKSVYPEIEISVLDIDSLWNELTKLPENVLASLFGDSSDDSKTFDRLEKRIEELAKRVSLEKGVPLATLHAILRAFDELGVPNDEVEGKLYAKAAEYKELKERLAKLSNDDPMLQRIRADAVRMIDLGDMGKADEFLARAESIDVAAAQELLQTANARLISAAESRAERAKLALLRSDYKAAANHFGEARRLAAHDIDRSEGYAGVQASCLMQGGGEFGDIESLSHAVEIYKDLLRHREGATVRRGTEAILKKIGDVYSMIGEYTSDVRTLNEAVAAYESVLTRVTPEQNSHLYGMALSQLAVTQKIIGELGNDTLSLRKAISAFRKALKTTPNKKVSPNEIMTRTNLASALNRLGSLEGDVRLLKEAFALYRRCEREAKSWPIDIHPAHIWINMATALHEIGCLQKNAKPLHRAIALYYKAVSGLFDYRSPLLRGLAYINMGNVFYSLAKLEGPAGSYYQEAIKAYDNALVHLSARTARSRWCQAVRGKGRALIMWGQEARNVDALTDAVAIFKRGSEAVKDVGDFRELAFFEEDRASALLALNIRSKQRSYLIEAAIATRSAIEGYQACGAIRETQRARQNLAFIEEEIRRASTADCSSLATQNGSESRHSLEVRTGLSHEE